MKSFWKIVAALALLVNFSLFVASDVAAKNENVPTMMDDGRFFSRAEEQELTKLMEDINSEFGVKLAIVTYKTLPSDTHARAVELMNDPAAGFTDAPNGGLLLVLNQNLLPGQTVATPGLRKYTIKTDARMSKIITTDLGLPYLTEKLVKPLKDNRFADGARDYLSAARECLSHYKEKGEPLDPYYDDNRIFSALVAFAAAGIVSYMCCRFLRRQMNRVTRAAQADAYVEKDSFELTHRSSKYLYSHTTVTEKGGDDRDDDDSGCGGDDDGGGSSSGSF